jgi:serine phosphatase RsbU (regulator of sigma subunit)
MWDRVRHTLTYSSAGHLPQLIIVEGMARLIESPPDPPLGVVRSASRHPSSSVDLRDGATLVLFTDGLVERRDESIDESLARLELTVRSWPPLGLEGLLDRLFDVAAGGVDDDVAILAVEIPPSVEPR